MTVNVLPKVHVSLVLTWLTWQYATFKICEFLWVIDTAVQTIHSFMLSIDCGECFCTILYRNKKKRNKRNVSTARGSILSQTLLQPRPQILTIPDCDSNHFLIITWILVSLLSQRFIHQISSLFPRPFFLWFYFLVPSCKQEVGWILDQLQNLNQRH